jgi:coenzyme F420-reducing hydrogenase delta subunit
LAVAAREEMLDGAPVLGVTCAGNLHTSVVEFLLRAGAGGVMVTSCVPRDCWNREGPKWLEQRLYHEREAELQERVDRRRIRLVHMAEAERPELLAALRDFRRDLDALAAAESERAIDLERECEIPTRKAAAS